MAYNLKVAMQQTVITLHKLGKSNRAIARELGINRKTVNRYVRIHQHCCPVLQNGPDPATGSGSFPTGLNPPSDDSRTSRCEPYHDFIEECLELGLSATRIHQDLVAEHDFSGAYNCVKRYIRKLRGNDSLPFRRMECDPGEEAQAGFRRRYRAAGHRQPQGRRQKGRLV